MSRLPLFSAFGVELEYMLVDARTLDVRPICDQVLAAEAGEQVADVERGAIAWSNELALHVIELKTNGPAESLAGLPAQFQENVARINDVAAQFGARLLPTAMHPWMDPHRELQLWPHDYGPVYETFHRIFDCRGHGWANLQSVHLNLPFANDDEFGRLHAAIRLILPLLPGLAASSPVMDGRVTGVLDNRLEVYRTNSRRIRSVTGRVIPEPAYTEVEYDRQIFQPMYAEIAPLDPDGVLQDEFLNARGAIARFSRGAIEIRVLDVQESPQMDVAICAALVQVLKQLVSERWSSLLDQQFVAIDPLESLLLRTIRDADAAAIEDVGYLRHFGAEDLVGGTVGDLWRRLINEAARGDREFDAVWGDTLNHLLTRGPLARAIRNRLGPVADRPALESIYGGLSNCLAHGRSF
jgi:carboxylate-amine ligase